MKPYFRPSSSNVFASIVIAIVFVLMIHARYVPDVPDATISAPAVAGCGPHATAKDALDAALTAQQLACIGGSLLTDAPELAKACRIADALLPIFGPILENLVRQRDVARRAGVVWQAADAGADASH
jgi:hypothetical protein